MSQICFSGSIQLNKILAFMQRTAKTGDQQMNLVIFPLRIPNSKKFGALNITKLQLQAHVVHTYTPTSHTHFSLYTSHKYVHIYRPWLLPGGGDHWQHT